jgi:putative sterol carrier protein
MMKHPPTRSFGAAGESQTSDEMRGQLTLKRYFLVSIGRLGVAIFLCVATATAASQADSTPQDIFDAMRNSFQPAKAKGVHASYQWDLSGPNGGQWWIEVNDGTYKMGKGTIPDPSVTFIAKDKDWVAICHDQLSGTWAYLVGRLKVRGDQGVARKLGEMFP